MEDRPENGERIFYIRDKKGQPVATLAYKRTDLGHVEYGFSVLHPNDRFDRSLGRRIALARLRQRPNVVGVDPDNPRSLTYALIDLAGVSDVPVRVRRHAMRWVYGI